MSRRVSIEQRVLDFFRTAPQEVAESILRLAVAEVKRRRKTVEDPDAQIREHIVKIAKEA